MSGVDENVESLKERGWRQVAAIDAALEGGEIDEAGWYRAVGDLIVPAYLAGDSPRAQSGHSGDAARWEAARRPILDAVARDGTFLDIGCANGHLMECVHVWARQDGIALEPWGLDISPELAALARARLPHWAERIDVGNVMEWMPPHRFDYVRTGLDYVPEARRPDLVRHLLEDVAAPSGRVIIGVFTEETEERKLQRAVESWGFTVIGATERPHPESTRVVRRAFWLDAPG